MTPARRLTRELERVLAAGYIRGADAWHVACALYLDPTSSPITTKKCDGSPVTVIVSVWPGLAIVGVTESTGVCAHAAVDANPSTPIRTTARIASAPEQYRRMQVLSGHG